MDLLIQQLAQELSLNPTHVEAVVISWTKATPSPLSPAIGRKPTGA